MNQSLISYMVLLPLLGAFVQIFLPQRWISLGTSVLSSILAVILISQMQVHTADIQIEHSFNWIGSYAISYSLGLDGLNALGVLLVAILFPVVLAAEWNQRVGNKGMNALFLVLQTALLGSLCAQDLFLQFFFWSLSSLPVFFLIGVWGGEQREEAAFRSVVISSIGNALVFAALLLIYYAVDPHTFLLKELAGGVVAKKQFEFLGTEFSVQTVSFILISLGLSLRAPVWPLHGWYTQLALEAPFSVLVAVSAAVVPVALILFVRLTHTLFPNFLIEAAPIIVIVGAVNLVLGGVSAVAQKGLRLLIAYLALIEVGLTLVGLGSLNSAGLVGAIYQILIFGLGIAGFGLFAGIINERVGHTHYFLKNGERGLGGIATRAPGVAVIAAVVLASIVGFPGFAGFVGHALLMIGSYPVHPSATLVAAGTLLVGAYTLFGMYRGVFLGKPANDVNAFSDLTLRERTFLIPLVTLLLIFGVYPKPFIELVKPTLVTLLSTIK